MGITDPNQATRFSWPDGLLVTRKGQSLDMATVQLPDEEAKDAEFSQAGFPLPPRLPQSVHTAVRDHNADHVHALASWQDETYDLNAWKSRREKFVYPMELPDVVIETWITRDHQSAQYIYDLGGGLLFARLVKKPYGGHWKKLRD